MSWLSPKRRRTTGNLKQIPHGQFKHAEEPTTPTQSGNTLNDRPLQSTRPLSQPSIETVASSNGDGNLFYAYARKGDDIHSRYLLTFASASIANEWWLLLQAHFPEATRPEPQLFSFKTDDLLSKVWKHSGFEHLKTKWMFIAFSNTGSDGAGGSADSLKEIIPVQDVEGNMLRGSTSPVMDGEAEVDGTMEAAREAAMEKKKDDQKAQSNGADGNGAYLDTGGLERHLGILGDLLTRNTEYVESMSKKQFGSEQRLIQTLEDVNAKQRTDHLEIQQLSSHLDRIQGMMEQSVEDRKDSARSSEDVKSVNIDFSPLTEKLEKMQHAVEQNSDLIKNLLDEAAAAGDSDVPKTPFWATAPPQQVDLTPLNEHLQKIHTAIEQQSLHVQALVGFASGDAGTGTGSPVKEQAPNLAPLGEHLEQIYNAIEEGNRHAKQAAIQKHLEGIDAGSRANTEVLREILDSQKTTRRALSQQEPLKVDLSSLGEHLEKLLEAQYETRNAVEANSGEIDVSPLIDQMESVREAIVGQQESLLSHLQSLSTATDQNAQLFTSKINANLKEQSIDLSPLNERLDQIREAVKNNSADVPRAIDFGPLTRHLEAIREATDANAEHIQEMVEAQRRQTATPAKAAELDLTPMTERLNKIHASLERANKQTSDKTTGAGDPKFLLSALTSHLSKIQAVTEQNAKSVQTLQIKQSSTQDKMHTALIQASEAVRGLATTNAETHKLLARRAKDVEDKSKEDYARLERRLEATSSQVRELMTGQREMTNVMRELAEAIKEQNLGHCDHVVVPPPRKMGRKIVGFVYEGGGNKEKEGPEGGILRR